jgi:hypothetical protein
MLSDLSNNNQLEEFMLVADTLEQTAILKEYYYSKWYPYFAENLSSNNCSLGEVLSIILDKVERATAIEALADVIKSNPPATILKLVNAKLHMNEYQKLAKSLSTNTHLQHLIIGESPLKTSANGIIALANECSPALRCLEITTGVRNPHSLKQKLQYITDKKPFLTINIPVTKANYQHLLNTSFAFFKVKPTLKKRYTHKITYYYNSQ